MQQDHSGLKDAAAATGLDLSTERLEVLATSASRVAAVLAALASIDYGNTEPAPRFRPASRQRDQ